MEDFEIGPFEVRCGREMRVNNDAVVRVTLRYNSAELAMHTVPAASTRSQVHASFEDDLAAFARKHQPVLERLQVIERATGKVVHSFPVLGMPDGLTPGLIDDRSEFWLRTENRLRSMPCTLFSAGQVAAKLAPPAHAWAAELLPESVMTLDESAWRSPTAWEIRHVVGEGSFTGVSGAKAAALVGVAPQNFRKYSARDGAVSRQSMSFSMWHLLLHRLDVQRMS